MAYYAKISNKEFIQEDIQKLTAASAELSAIIATNEQSKEYADKQEECLIATRDNSNDVSLLMSELNTIKYQNTEDKQKEIDDIQLGIDNSIARVTEMKTGVDEYTNENGEITEKDNTVYWERFYGGCKRTSYNTKGGVHTLGGTPFRKNYAGVGYIYDPVRDAFYTEQPYDSWTLDESTCYWQPPTPVPDGRGWYWKEDTTEWVDYVYYNEPKEKSFESWTWNSTTGEFEPPIEMPDDEWIYYWDENKQQWVKYRPK